MFARRTSESETGSAEWQAALAAGWRRSDILWERWQERGNAAWESGDVSLARRRFLFAWCLARLFFRHGDPRIATSIANIGFIAREAGQFRLASRHYARARRLWAEVPGVLDGIEFRPRVRSSLFHLRMETRHRETYETNMRARIANFVTEAGQALEAAEEGAPSPHRLYDRWRGERPAVFDESRKLLGAALLICARKQESPDPDRKVGG
ncbi:MAG: tetratricopeptide repeat-containing protein [Boseongicola sp. SB0676_bin_33]|uniref:Tetratricopeptide repeat-containing protein n=1 Tax=Boseongicola sp. SB0664_bin_43 TaxID=2604844 RepID=A0A6B0Y353_9RHOB|nr:tetratricopeptide repeat-containing protein [Boseongicola sp. SB0664_bin_43]MYF88762.1 tetratricopeptide repeat-containing protein [Boseongicola sp. SB0676_bin_33]MYK32468.1 tetratricopeptide repeat-containing protein [Boseongicola sp. SB0670_bin_30]